MKKSVALCLSCFLVSLALLISRPQPVSASSETDSSPLTPVETSTAHMRPVLNLLRNNPFTYHYETTPMKLLTTQHYTAQEAFERDFAFRLMVETLKNYSYTEFLGRVIELYSAVFDRSINEAGTLKIWGGEKRKIATSGITEKSHVVDRWFTYRFLYTGDDGSVLLDRSGSLRAR